MIRLSELKLPLAQVPTEHRRAADAPAEYDLIVAPQGGRGGFETRALD